MSDYPEHLQEHEQSQEEENVHTRGLLKFLLPSLFGVFIFLFPIFDGGTFNIPLGIITEYIIDILSNWLPAIVTLIMVISTVFTVVQAIFKPRFIQKSALFMSLFNVTIFWTILRILGTIFAIMTYFGAGMEIIYSELTGEVMFGLLTSLIVWFFVASFLMPYLINFGVMEFFGSILRGIIKPLFTLPGRSAIDLLSSWIGNVNVGVVITREQYQNGFYTGREAAAIATCFSTVSLPFCLVIAGMLEVDHMFPLFYLAIVVAGIVSAVIVPRIPPIANIPDQYYTNNDYQEDVPANISKFKWGIHQAVKRAESAGSFKEQVKQGNSIFLGIAFVLLPQVMAIGTIALVIAEFTSFFEIISQPIIPLLEVMQLPNAADAAPATIIGFIDMFLPAVLASGIEAEITRFVIGALSLVQIIYLTEMGTLLLISKIPVKAWHLFIIFLERTIISLPIIVIIAHLIY
ncbi:MULTISPECIES: YjiH family protein [Virgibacillus]|uniref:Nucleoside recognition n=1 Tax=Virgibacillus massiliensis TaxID=1462526 RepID=A0A024QE86_9BACI|nr:MULTISPECIES: YjiH family protein [Virgibacillus]EQB36773.1 membrane protein [Virgibacillus sp. CM-4]MYL42598.1 YjiH family protein [Virgibacillus massiliensis]CDQ40480.1 Nucleoside recognition [Virgibacillus massiliensis]